MGSEDKLSKSVRVVLLGPPAAGKGTQAALLAKKLGIAHVSTGEILRSEIASGSELGLHAKALMDKGNLVPDDVVLGIIKKKVSSPECKKGFVLDGYPRTLPQAKSLDELLSEVGKPLTSIVDIKVDDKILIERIQKRATAGSGRSDDNQKVAEHRLQVYWEQTAPVADFYKKANRVKEISGLGTVEEISESILKIVLA